MLAAGDKTEHRCRAREDTPNSSQFLNAPAPSLAEIVGWDVGNWAQALRFWEQASRISFHNPRVLELGTGDGGLSLWLACKGFQVICSDISGPKPEATKLHIRYGVNDRIEYRAVDATAIPFRAELDVVCFKSMLGAVGSEARKDRQQRAVDEMHAALKPGGEVWFAENLVGSALHRFCRERFVPWGITWRWISVTEVEEFFQGFSHLEYVTIGVVAVFGRREWQRRALSWIDRRILRYVRPEWRYVVAGVARK